MFRSSDIEFQSFENSWLVAPQKRQQAGLVKSIAVMPFVGDSAMAERWIAVFRETTDLRMVSQSDATQYGISDHGQIGLAQRIARSFKWIVYYRECDWSRAAENFVGSRRVPRGGCICNW